MRSFRNQACDAAMDFMEVFAGKANITREFLRNGYRGCGIDVNFFDDDSHNLLSSTGLRLALDAVSTLRSAACLWIATPCSSFVILCRAQSKRYPANNFLGDCSRPFVQAGNMLLEASSILYFIGWALGVHVILENPTSSVIGRTPSLCGLFSLVRPWCFTTYMGAFFGRTVKPLFLWSTLGDIRQLAVDRPNVPGDDELVHRDGQRFTGCKLALQESEVYTPAFARAVVSIFSNVWAN